MPNKRASLKSYLPHGLIVLSSFLMWFCFTPWDYRHLIWILLIPYFYVLSTRSNWRQAMLQGFWLGFCATVIGFTWVAHVLHEFGNLPWPIAGMGLVLFGFICQPQFYLFAPVFFYFEKKYENSTQSRVALALGLGFFYTGLDWILPKLWQDTLGHALYTSVHFRQLADIGGAPLLTVIIFWVNYSLYLLIREIKQRKEPSIWPAWAKAAPPLTLAFTAVLVAFVYGHFRNQQILQKIAHAPRFANLALIQGNIGDFDKFTSEHGSRGAVQKILNVFFGLSDQAMNQNPKPDAIVWPETSYPGTFRNPANPAELSYDQAMENYAKLNDTPLLFGGYDHFNRKDHNAFFFLSPNLDLQIYRKSILLLFGEYIPFYDDVAFLKETFPQVGNFGRGQGPSVLTFPLRDGSVVKTNPIICYEALFPSFVIAGARLGSEMILNITNDSWFGPRGEPQLHFSLTTFRAIETRLPEVRATNTGISALVLPDGTIAKTGGIDTAEVVSVHVPLTEPIPTLMKLWGDWFGPTSFGLGIILLLIFYFNLQKASEQPSYKSRS